ncbi:hypothetical protein E1294_44365 [Nonomuraea diastatica]|uniref:Uncharacterized protein n=1 Tax=Nonomuraea diastatica TaxID=1848329 RepID=A0A4V2YCL6_9ACTN|nr:hypothetical protein E1294_44365 [Nonomuraea diastatica]
MRRSHGCGVQVKTSVGTCEARRRRRPDGPFLRPDGHVAWVGIGGDDSALAAAARRALASSHRTVADQRQRRSGRACS